MRDQVKYEQQTRADCEARLTNLQRQLKTDKGNPLSASTPANPDIQSALSIIQAAMTGGDETKGFYATVSLEKHISDLAATVTESRERLIQQAEVQRSILFIMFEVVLISATPTHTTSNRKSRLHTLADLWL